MDEPALITDAKRGDIHAFNTLVLHYQQPVYNYALRMMGDPASAEDATQQAVIAAWKALRRFQNNNFKGWLLTIVHRKCLDLIRKMDRHPEPSIEATTEENESPRWLQDGSMTPEERMTQRETAAQIQQCLSKLPDAQRAAVVLYDVEGYDYGEIAQILNVSLGTVKSRLNRARRKLQDCLRSLMELLPDKYR